MEERYLKKKLKSKKFQGNSDLFSSKKISLFGATIASSKKAENILILNVSKICYFADFFVICSCSSTKQAKVIADSIIEKFKEYHIKYDHIEGHENGQWILLDYGDVIFHIFLEETRKFYQIEDLWGDAERIHFEETEFAIKEDLILEENDIKYLTNSS